MERSLVVHSRWPLLVILADILDETRWNLQAYAYSSFHVVKCRGRLRDCAAKNRDREWDRDSRVLSMGMMRTGSNSDRCVLRSLEPRSLLRVLTGRTCHGLMVALQVLVGCLELFILHTHQLPLTRVGFRPSVHPSYLACRLLVTAAFPSYTQGRARGVATHRWD